VPFLIDWGATRHPAESGLPPAGLVSLTIAHPDVEVLRTYLAAVGVEVSASDDAQPPDAGGSGPRLTRQPSEGTGAGRPWLVREPEPRLAAVVSGRFGRVTLA
jgi:hypothetical protein